MKTTIRASLIALASLAAACGGPASEARKAQTTLAPPAPEGALSLHIETLAEGLVNPWSMAFLPDGSMLVTERDGKLRVIRNGALVAEPVSGVPATYVKSQGGLFDILLHPDFAANRTLFLSYAALLGDRTMLITIGDGFNYREKAQDLSNGLGKIVRVNLDGSIPADNPFADKEGARREIYSFGHRNEQGLAVDPADGTIYETEHGPMGGDELNIIEAGANYGWPLATYGLDYSGAQITPFTEYEGSKQPVKYWVPSIGPSGLAIYQGDLFPGWKGDLLVGALAKTALHRLDMEDGKVVGEERYLDGERIRDVREGPDGAIYVTTEDHDGAPVGKVLRLTPAQ